MFRPCSLSSTVVLAAALALSACGGGEPAPSAGGGEGGQAKADGPRDMLIYATGSDLGSLLFPVYTSAADSVVMDQIYYGPLESEFECKLDYKPGLFDAWEWNDDGTEVTYTLRDDISWADGTPVTAEDLKFTFDLIADTSVGSPRIGYLENMAEEARPAIDGNKVTFRWTRPGDKTTRMAMTAVGLVPKHKLEKADRSSLKGHELSLSPLASGPFKLSEHKPKQYFVLEPNEAFTGPADMQPKLKRVMFKIVPEYQTRLLQLKKGEIDLLDGIKVTDADELRESAPNLDIRRRGYRFMDYIAWNLRDPRFQDKRVRQAFAHAVDVEFMISKLLKSKTGEVYGKPAVSTITPELCGIGLDRKPFAHDVDKAKALLAEAGWTDTDGDGVVDKGGQKLSFTLVTNRENERRMEAAQLVQEALKNIGVEMTLDTMEFNAMTDKLRKREFEAVLGGWSAGLFVDPSAMWMSETEDTPRQFNYPGYSNPKVDELIEQGLATPDMEQAAPIWNEMQNLVYEDQPYLFLWWRDELVAVDKRFDNAQIDILSLMKNLHEWEVPADKVKYDF